MGIVGRKHASVGEILVLPKEPTHFGNITGLSGSASTEVGDLWVYKSNNAWATSKVLEGNYEMAGLTASLFATNDVVSGSQQILDYNLFAVTSSDNTFYGEQTITGSLMISGSGSLNGDNIVSSNTIMKIETISSASYAALTPPVSGTLYIII